MSHFVPAWLRSVVRGISPYVCAGICRGDDWILLDGNSALADFFRKEKDALASEDRKKKNTVEESLFALFYRAGCKTAVDRIRSGEAERMIVFAVNAQSYIFAWVPVMPEIQETNNDSCLRFFFFHKMPQSPALSECELLSRELQVIIDSIHDGIWVIDGNGWTVHVNKAMKRIADIDPAEVIGKHVSEPMQEGKFSSCVTLIALEQKKPVTLFDDYACGNRCLNTSTPIFDANGDIWRVVASIRDMTELEILQKRLAEAERAAHIYKDKLDSMQKNRPPGFIANSKMMRSCLRELEKAAKAPSGILILGETGTGKTLAASLVHQKSPRAKGPFITINCAAIPSTLIESELFGYERGAFTGAGHAGKKGFFELADKGTILLDEIGELPLGMQAKLLHVLDSQTFHKIGGEKSIKVDVRIIAATNKPLEELVTTGEFRADLYYRLRVLTVLIPPLREHPEDIPELAMSFLEDACRRHGSSKTFSPKVLRVFAAHSWPGNVRELRAAVEFLAAMAEGSIIRLADLPPHILDGNVEGMAIPVSWVDASGGEAERPDSLKGAVRALERKMISNALKQSGSSYKAAKLLGISQSSVVRKAHQLGIKVAEEPQP